MFSKSTIGVFDWIVYFILSVIPPINFIMWLVLLLSKETNKTLRNFILAQITLVFIGFGFLILVLLVGSNL